VGLLIPAPSCGCAGGDDDAGRACRLLRMRVRVCACVAESDERQDTMGGAGPRASASSIPYFLIKKNS
jgi:hypothetical protein